MTLLHAGCVCVGGKGVLFLGESGSGKSDLALRMIDAGAQLVADDQVELKAENGALIASAPEKIRFLLEARGVGILQLPHQANATVALAVSLVVRANVERLPEPAFFSCEGVRVPLLSLHAFDASTPAKIRLFLSAACLPLP